MSDCTELLQAASDFLLGGEGHDGPCVNQNLDDIIPGTEPCQKHLDTYHQRYTRLHSIVDEMMGIRPHPELSN